MKIFKFVVAALLVGGAIGFIPSYLQLRDARETAAAEEQRLTMELDATRSSLALSSIHSQVGILLMQVRTADFDAARKTSTALYDSVNTTLGTTEDADDERRLRTIAETRDQVTAALALNDPAIEDTLWRLLGLLSASLV